MQAGCLVVAMIESMRWTRKVSRLQVQEGKLEPAVVGCSVAAPLLFHAAPLQFCNPSAAPTKGPSMMPSSQCPSSSPSGSPTAVPTRRPSCSPSSSPTAEPSCRPSSLHHLPVDIWFGRMLGPSLKSCQLANDCS